MLSASPPVSFSPFLSRTLARARVGPEIGLGISLCLPFSLSLSLSLCWYAYIRGFGVRISCSMCHAACSM